MNKIWDGVKGIIRKDGQILILVKHNNELDLPGGRVENGETIEFALLREIGEETGLKVEIHNPVEEWSFYKTPNFLVSGITLECSYLDGNVNLSGEHKRYFWATNDSLNRLNFNHNFI